jgi:hypothetical protein
MGNLHWHSKSAGLEGARSVEGVIDTGYNGGLALPSD